MATRLDIRVEKTHLDAEVGVTNLGPGTAHRVKVRLRAFGETWTSPSIKVLGSGRSESFPFRALMSTPHTGSYPVSAEVAFRDAGHHRYTTFAATTAVVGVVTYTRPDISVRSGDLTLGGSNNLVVKVSADLETPRPIRASLLLPSGIATEKDRLALQVGSGVQTLLFPLRTTPGYAGAPCRYLLFLEYDADGHHYSLTSGGEIRPREETVDWFTRTRWYWLAGLGVWLLVWAVSVMVVTVTGRKTRT